MKNIKIASKLIAAFLLISILAAILGTYMETKITDINKRDLMLYEQGVEPLGLLVKTAEQAQELRVQALYYQISTTNEERQSHIKALNESYAILKDVLGQQINLAMTEDGKQKLIKLQAAVDKYVEEMHAFEKVPVKECPHSGVNLNPLPQSIKKAAEEVYKTGNAAIVDKIKVAEEMAKTNGVIANRASSISKIAIAVIFIFSVISGLILTFSITAPLKEVVKEISRMEGGDMTVRSNLERTDELGTLSKALDHLAGKMQTIMKGLHLNSNTLTNAAKELSSVSRQLSSGAEETVAQSNSVASTAEQMSVNINAMASGAEQASVNANEVAGAAEEMSTNMNTIAGAIEEMSSSIREIANNANEVHKIVSSATKKSDDATSVMNKLGLAAKEIGKVTELIKRIADKTNLLALNASIEAASAGDAGRGFAVVANEIKELSNQSAKSADDIAVRIDTIQSGTSNAALVIHDVSDIITKINQSVDVISDHIDQQTKASNEIAHNVSQANVGAQRVASAIGEVAKGATDVSRNASEAAKGATNVSENAASMSKVAKESSQGATQVNQSASGLTKIVDDLKETTEQFKV